MTTHSVSRLSLCGGQVLREEGLEQDTVCIEGGRIEAIGTAAAPRLDVSGYLLLPGIIDLHGDAFERHIAPRPTAPFPIEMGLAATDRDAAAHGVTTAWMAQSWSWEGGHRGPAFAEDFLEAHHAYRSRQLTDLRVQIRCETHTVETETHLLDVIRTYGVDYVIFNNHLDEALAMAKSEPERVAQWAEKAGRTVNEHMELVHGAMACASSVPRYLCNLASAFDSMGVRYGSHDDPDASTRENFSMIGAKICEFPTGFSAAAAARAWGDPVLMGAPNIVRGGSQSGNVAAIELVKEELCSALVSDYHYPTLHHAAFWLSDRGMHLADAWAMIAAAPARIMGLKDRGVLAPGMRADMVVVHAKTRAIEGTMVGGRWSYLAGGLAQRFTMAPPRIALAAE